jgi:membrane protein implicated in regulation of membrane protease activity
VADFVLWLVAAMAELFTLTFVLGLLAVAAVVAAAAALLDAPLAAQIGLFALSSGGLLVVVRPFARRQSKAPGLTTGTAALPGRMAIVTEAVGEHAGRVKLGGESWAARSPYAGEPLPVGSKVTVAKVDGATLVVYPEEI